MHGDNSSKDSFFHRADCTTFSPSVKCRNTGVRVITNLGKPSTVGFSVPPRAGAHRDRRGRVVLKFRSVNETLQDVFQVSS